VKEQKKSFAFGWSMVVFAFLGFFLTTYFDVMSPNVFVPALAEAHGFSSANLLAAHSVGGICGALLGIYLGRVIESRGPKIVFVVSAIISGINFAMIGVATTEIWAMAHIFINQLLVLGYSMMSLLSLMARWFPKKKGFIMGLVTSGSIGSGVVILPLANSLLASKGIAVSQGVVGALLVILGLVAIPWVRNTPREVGLYPDNIPLTPEELAIGETSAAGIKSPWTIGKVYTCVPLVIMVLCAGFVTVGNLGAQTCGVGILTERGLDATMAVTLLGAGGVIGFIGSNLSGVLDQKFNSYVATVVLYVIAAVGYVLMWFGTGMVAGVGFICQGAVVGAVNNLLPSHIITRCGPQHYDAIYSYLCPVTRLLASFGSLIMSFSLRVSGLYYGGVVVCAILTILALVVFAATQNTKHIAAPGETSSADTFAKAS
jgi:MFS family permease